MKLQPIGTRVCVALGRAALLVVACVSAASADGIRIWDRDIAVAAASGDQGWLRPVVVTDGDDGAFVIWPDRQRSQIYLQRVGGDGSKAWPAARQVASTVYEKFTPSAVSTGHGEIVVAWTEGRNGAVCAAGIKAECDIYAQKYDRNGQRLWSNIGRPVVRAAANQGVSGIALASDGEGGVYVAWEDARPSCCKVYAQHLDADGRPLWAVDGIRLSPEPHIVIGPMDSAPLAASDSEGGVYVAWIDNQVNPDTSPSSLKVQRLDSDGTSLWMAGGIHVGEPSSVPFSVAPGESGSVLLGFTSVNDIGYAQARVQKVALDGTTPWGTAGVLAAINDYFQFAPEVVSDGRGGAYVAWVDYTYERFTNPDADIRAQRVLADGTRVWPVSGRILSDSPGDQDNPRIVRDLNGGAFVFWRDCRDYLEFLDCVSGSNIYGQHIRRNGTLAWASQGTPVSKATGPQGIAQGTPMQTSTIAATWDQGAGAIVAWPDGRVAGCDNAVWTTECDVRAQHVADDPSPSVADLGLAITISPEGGSGTRQFTVTVSNFGPETAHDIKVLMPDLENLQLWSELEDGVIVGSTLYFSLGTLAVGRSRKTSFSLNPLGTGQICVNGKVYADELDTESTNSRARACLTVP